MTEDEILNLMLETNPNQWTRTWVKAISLVITCAKWNLKEYGVLQEDAKTWKYWAILQLKKIEEGKPKDKNWQNITEEQKEFIKLLETLSKGEI